MSKIDETGATIKIDPASHIVRVDGIIVCKAVRRGDGVIYLQFKDCDRRRSWYRKTAFVEVPAEVFLKVLKSGEFWSKIV